MSYPVPEGLHTKPDCVKLGGNRDRKENARVELLGCDGYFSLSKIVIAKSVSIPIPILL